MIKKDNTMKKQIIAIHGGESYLRYDKYLEGLESKEVDRVPVEYPKGWRQNLPDDLGEDYEVFMPSMPNKQNAKYAEWKIWFEKYMEFIDQEVILVGHSLGAMFLARYLGENTPPKRVSSLHLVGGAYERMVEASHDDGGDFYTEKKNFLHIGEVVDAVHIYHSKDDDIVPYKKAFILGQSLPEAEFITFQDRGHFLQEHFPELIERIKIDSFRKVL